MTTLAPATSFTALIGAESYRATRTRALIILPALALAAALAVVVGGAVRSAPVDAGAALVEFADVIGFAVFLAAGLAVGGDYGTGAIEHVRVLAPRRARHLAARACAMALLATIASACYLAIGATVLAFIDPALPPLGAAARVLVTAAALGAAGAGVGALTRSAAGAVFVVLALYVLVPVGFMVAQLSGVGWADGVSAATIGVLAAKAAGTAPDSITATGGVLGWCVGLLAAGAAREAGIAGARRRARG